MRQISSIRRRLQDPARIPGPGLSVDKLDTYADHFAQVFCESEWAAPSCEEEISASNDLRVTHHQLLRAMLCMPNNKAPGPDGVTAEILKLGGQSLASVMCPLYKAISVYGMVPSEWNVAALQLIWKAKGRRDDVEMYRPIALTSVFRKLLEKTIKPKLKEPERRLDIAQGGFRKGRSTYDLVLALDMIVKSSNRKKKPCWQAFLDIKGAYDTVNRDILWQECRRMGIRGGLHNLLKCLFDYTSVVLRIGGQVSRKILMGRGLLQGSLLSPLLFNIFIDSLPRILRRKHPSYSIGGCRINSLLYADNIVLMSSSREKLQNMMDTCEKHSIRYGYVFSPPKCEIISPTAEGCSRLKLYCQEVRGSSSFKYLGIPVTETGIKVSAVCVEGISRAVKTASLFSTIGCNGRGFSPATSRWILTTFVRPQMEYGIGLTFLGTGLENVLNKAWCGIWRKALSLPQHTSGSAVLKMMGVSDMTFRARKLNVLMMKRAYRANPNSLIGIIYGHATKGAGRRIKKSLIVRSRRNPMLGQSLINNNNWERIEEEYVKGQERNAPQITSSRIKRGVREMDACLRHRSLVSTYKDVVRKLILWRTGVIPGKLQKCQGCDSGAYTNRDHVIECSELRNVLDSKKLE